MEESFGHRKYPDLINVFYTTRGVMTKIKHPKGGYNQLWRSDAYDSLESLSAIFENPRIHTGRGYRRAENALRGCAECGLQKERSEYSSNQWRKGFGASKCHSCLEQKQSSIKASGTAGTVESATNRLLDTIRRLDPEQCKPFGGRWRDFNVDRFREILAMALAEQPHYSYDGGYSWLVDTPESYSRRIGRFVAPHEMPKAPDVPIIETSELKAYLNWNIAALAALQQRFPKCLEHILNCPAMKPRLIDPPNPLYTIREAIEYVEQVAEKTFFKFEEMALKLQNALYTPSTTGPQLFFQRMAAYKQSLDQYGYGAACEIGYWTLTIYCMMAIRNSELPESKIDDIERAWRMETYPPEGPELFQVFIDFVTPKIMELEAIHFSNLSKESIAEVDRQDATQSMVKWRQWKFWCFTCGCNLTHNSDNCSRPNRHHKIAATFDHKLGGNSKKDHLRLKWCHPFTKRPYENPLSNRPYEKPKPFDLPKRKANRDKTNGTAKPFTHRTGNGWLRLVSSIQCDAEGCDITPTIRCEKCQMAYYCSFQCQRSHHDHCKQIMESELTNFTDMDEFELRAMAMACQFSDDRGFLMTQAEYVHETNRHWEWAVLAGQTDTTKKLIQERALLTKALCRRCYELKLYDRAVEFGKLSIELNRRLQQVHYYLARAQLATGKHQEAIKMMERSILYEAPHDEANKKANEQYLSQIVAN